MLCAANADLITGSEFRESPGSVRHLVMQEARLMYAQYWGLTESPFKSSLNVHWFQETPGHEEALARLLFLVEERRRCGVLIGPAGAGKSLLAQVVHRQVRRTQREVASIDLLGRNARELLWETAAALGLAPRPADSSWNLWRILQDHLMLNEHAQFHTVLLFDHLDRSESDCAGALQRMFHLNAAASPSITFLLTTRNEHLPRLAGLLGELSDLRIELPPLDRQQVGQYIEAQLKKAGARTLIFEADAIDRLYEFSQGIPRDLNRLCDLSLIAGMAESQTSIDASVVISVAEELHQLSPQFEGPGTTWANRLAVRSL